MQSEINVDRFINDTITHLNRTLDRSEAMVARLTINTMDTDGARECIEAVKAIRNALIDAEDKLR